MKRILETAILAALLVGAVSCDGSGKDDPSSKAPAVPSGLKLHDVTETDLTFQWDAVSGAASYDWKLSKGGTEVDKGSVSGRNVIVGGLEAGTQYRFGIRAVNAEGLASDFTYLEARTSDAGQDEPDPGPGPDTDLSKYYSDFKIPSAEEDGEARAFPGAEGGGMSVTGGRGGKVIHVKNLNDSGEGSFRQAVCGTSGKRTVVFDVAGTINLKSDITISSGDLTIAGQTAPGDGICLKNYTTQINADNVIIRFLRFRLGDEAPWTQAQIDAGDADGQDCIWGRYHKDIIIDHCSMTWSIDECASFYANKNFTLQWCVVGESMKDCKLHTKDSHGFGGIWGGENASFHHNLLIHNDSRNARIDHPHIYLDHRNPSNRGHVDYRNNVIYNWGDNSTYGGEGGWFNVVGNYYKPGPSSKQRNYFLDLYGVYSKCSFCNEQNIEEGYPDIYIASNVHASNSSISSDNASGIYYHNGEGHDNYRKTLSAPLAISESSGKPAFTTTHSAQKAMEAVCSWGGASLSRDKVDARLAADVKAGTGILINDIAAVKAAYGFAWPEYTASDDQMAKVADSDHDGIPDWFETAYGLDKADPSDAASFSFDPKKRYTNLEMYLHYLVRNIVASQNADGEYTRLD